MTEDGTKLSMKEKLFDMMVSASNAVSKTSNVSTFATTGKLTPEEVRRSSGNSFPSFSSSLFLVTANFDAKTDLEGYCALKIE